MFVRRVMLPPHPGRPWFTCSMSSLACRPTLADNSQNQARCWPDTGHEDPGIYCEWNLSYHLTLSKINIIGLFPVTSNCWSQKKTMPPIRHWSRDKVKHTVAMSSVTYSKYPTCVPTAEHIQKLWDIESAEITVELIQSIQAVNNNQSCLFAVLKPNYLRKQTSKCPKLSDFAKVI